MRHKHLLIGDWVLVVAVMVGYCTDDNATNGPEHLQHLGSRGTKLNRHDLTTVRWRVGNEDAPRYTLEKLRHENNWERLGEVKGEDEDIQEHEAGQGRVTVSNAAGKRSS